MYYIFAIVVVAMITLEKAVSLLNKKKIIWNSLFFSLGILTIIMFILTEYIVKDILALYVLQIIFATGFSIFVLIDLVAYIRNLIKNLKDNYKK